MEVAFLKTVKDPEFVAEAEKTRVTLNPIPGTTLHNMIIEGLSIFAAQRKAQADPHAEGLALEWSLLRNRNIFRLSVVGSFLDREIPRASSERDAQAPGHGPSISAALRCSWRPAFCRSCDRYCPIAKIYTDLKTAKEVQTEQTVHLGCCGRVWERRGNR
jgi:hypothetical protein